MNKRKRERNVLVIFNSICTQQRLIELPQQRLIELGRQRLIELPQQRLIELGRQCLIGLISDFK